MSTTKFKTSQKIDANFHNASLDEVMEVMLQGTALTYTIEENAVTIKEKTASFVDRIISNFSAIDVRGTVVGDRGNPLSGATVKVKGTNKTTATNEKDEFYLQGIDENAVLVITYLGFEQGGVRIPFEEGIHERGSCEW